MNTKEMIEAVVDGSDPRTILEGKTRWIPANKGDVMKVGTATLRYDDGEWELSQGDNDFYFDIEQFGAPKGAPFNSKKDQTVRITDVKRRGPGFVATVK